MKSIEIFTHHPETEHVFQIDMPGQSISGMALKPWDARSKSTNALQPVVQQELSKVAGIRVVAFQPPPLPGSIGLPVQFVIGTTEPFEQLFDVAQKFLREAQQSGNFIFLDSDLKIDNPQSNISIDRDKTAQLGLKMSDVGGALASMLGGGYINYFSMSGRSYKVIPQVQQRFRLNPKQLLDYHIRTADGTLVPLSTIATVTTKTVPESLNHFQQLNSATIQGVAMPGVPQGDALAYLQKLAARMLPRDYSIDYGGLSRQYVQESSGFVATFGFALIIIFLALAALFESFRDPVIILVSVPMSIAGALIFISLGFGGASLNIYTEVGLVTLMGLISKHGILIVQFANDLQAEGRGKREAVELAAGISLRPILMTTAAMVLGVVPLITAGGAGAVSRVQMGIVIAAASPSARCSHCSSFRRPMCCWRPIAPSRKRLPPSTRTRRVSEPNRWKTGTRVSISSSRMNVPGRRAISWHRCRCNARGLRSISAAGRATRPSFWSSAFRNPKLSVSISRRHAAQGA